jgi:hypothetical protein
MATDTQPNYLTMTAGEAILALFATKKPEGSWEDRYNMSDDEVAGFRPRRKGENDEH